MSERAIDLVYTWCDGNDPKMRGLHKKFGQENMNHKRYTDNGELKYSLRSVSKYGKIFNKIFIVHDDCQIPKWLNIDHPRIVLVPHSSIIPKKYLPTFNSYAIELFLHKIEGLSDIFVYSNDDCFFGKVVGMEDFINNDGQIIVPCKNITIDRDLNDSLWKMNLSKAVRCLDKIDEKPRTFFSHFHLTISKDIFEVLWRLLRDDCVSLANHKFRNKDNFCVITVLKHLLCDFGNGIESEVKDSRLCGGQPNPYQIKKFNCANSGHSSGIKMFYESHFPDKSEFERR